MNGIFYLSTNISSAVAKIHECPIHIFEAKGGPSLKWPPAFNIVNQVGTCVVHIETTTSVSYNGDYIYIN